MNWLRRKERSEPSSAPESAEPDPGRVERTSRGISTLLSTFGDERDHSVLDLGRAAGSSLEVYRRFARWVRFADLLFDADAATDLTAALEAIPRHPERPYDVLLAWNLLDRVAPEERARVVSRLADLSAEDARLYLIVEPSAEGARQPFRFGLADVDRIWYEPAEEPLEVWPPLLPAELERLIEPFHVAHAFTTRVGLREYVATRRRR